MLTAAKLEQLIIGEVSLVDDPANMVPGWLVMKDAAARRRTLPQLAPEHARALPLILSPVEKQAVAAIEAEGALMELERRGYSDVREVVGRVRDEFFRLRVTSGGFWR